MRYDNMKTPHLITALVLFLVVSTHAQNAVIGTYRGVVHHDTITREVALTLQSDSTFLVQVNGDSSSSYEFISHGTWRTGDGWIYFNVNDEFVLHNTRGRDKKSRKDRMEGDFYNYSLRITTSADRLDRIYFKLESFDPDFISGEHYLEKQGGAMLTGGKLLAR